MIDVNQNEAGTKPQGPAVVVVAANAEDQLGATELDWSTGVGLAR